MFGLGKAQKTTKCKKIIVLKIKSMNKTNLSILVLATVFFTSCYYDNFKELHPDAALTVSNCDSSGVISYSAQIVPVLKSGCTTQCHGGIGGGGGHDMTTWVGVNADVVSGKLVSSVVWDGNAQKMPQGATTKISVCDIAKIKKWAAAAGPNN